jgi:hypothetical protein
MKGDIDQPPDDTPEALVRAWRERAAKLREWAGAEAEGAAHAYEYAARELERALGRPANELLTLTAAASVSGYRADHLGRLVRSGALMNYGRRNAPRVRRGDLPLKADRPAAGRGAYDPVADAKSIIAREVVRRTRGP